MKMLVIIVSANASAISSHSRTCLHLDSLVMQIAIQFYTAEIKPQRQFDMGRSISIGQSKSLQASNDTNYIHPISSGLGQESRTSRVEKPTQKPAQNLSGPI
jgi:hypothetical protein